LSLWEKLTGWLSEDQHERAHVVIRPDHVENAFTPTPIVADSDYFRVSVAQMYLKKKSKLFQDYYPAVHSLVQCSFAGQSVDIPNVADPSTLLQQDGKGDWIARNFILLPLMPFKGGQVKLVAGLFAVKGENRLNEFIGVLGGFAKLLAVPQLSAALNVAQPLANGIQTLFGGGGMHLGYQDTFVGAGGQEANYLKHSYIALIRTVADDALQNRLFVVNGELREGTGLQPGQHSPYESADFMLLHIEVRDARDDWNQLTSIATARKAAMDALVEGDMAKADAQLKQALLAAFQAPEITGMDRRRVVELLKSEYNEAKNAFGTSNLAEVAGQDLQNRMDRSAISAATARKLGEPTFDEVFASM
jgi:hypothetical protein